MGKTKKDKFTNANAAHYNAIVKVERIIRDIEYKTELAKRQHDLEKAQLKNAQIYLRDLIRDGESGDFQASLPGLEHHAIDRDVATWRSITLATAIHNKGLVKLLSAEGIETLGQLADFTDSDKSLVSIVGEKGEAIVVESMQLFWAANPGYDKGEQ